MFRMDVFNIITQDSDTIISYIAQPTFQIYQE